MTLPGLTDYGEEFFVKYVVGTVSKPSTLELGLYDDELDSLSESSDLSDIDTEPTTGNYSRWTYAFDDTELGVDSDSSNNWYIDFLSRDLNVDNTTETVDSFFVSCEFFASGDGEPTPHLIGVAPIVDSDGRDVRYHLEGYTWLTFNGRLVQQ